MSIERINSYNFDDKAQKEIIELLLSIYALKEALRDNQLLYETGFFGAGSS